MILLFNKTYLKIDRLIKGSRSRIVISKNYAAHTFIGNSLDISLSGTKVEQAMFQAGTVDELIDGDFGGDPDKLFLFLYQQRNADRLTIYCDADALVTLLMKYWKTLYPGMNENNMYMLLNFHLSQLNEIVGQGYTSFARISTDNAADIRNTCQGYLNADREQEVKQLWADTTPWRISRDQRETLIKGASVELQLCNVILDPAWRYASTVQDKVETMVHKQIIHEYAQSVKYVLLSSLANFKQYEPSTQFDIRTHTLQQLVEMHPQYQFLTDKRFIPDEYLYVFQTYDFGVLREIYQNVVREQHGSSVDWAPLLTKQHVLADLIAFEVSTPTTKMFLTTGDYEERINPYMIQWIFDSVRLNDVQRLAAFKL